jgi:ABC-2 type transport system ATP-binding protein
VIEVSGLTKYYGNFKAIEDVSFTVQRGEILGFLGPNGAGKTTTMRILTGYMPATGGTCRIGGLDVFEQPVAVKRKIGYLPENVPLYPEFTVTEYLQFVARIKGVPKGDGAAVLERIVGRCGLESVRNRLIAQLSKGFRQRVGLAQALIHDPEVIVLDEPTIGLDPAQIREVRELIKGLGRDHTIILSSHILPEVSQVCDRVVIINKGRIVAEDTPENLTVSAAGQATLVARVGGDEAAVNRLLQDEDLAPGGTHTREDGGLWRLTAPLDDAVRMPRIARRVVEAGLELHELTLRRATLEDVFLELITDEHREAADAAAAEPAADAPPAPQEASE